MIKYHPIIILLSLISFTYNVLAHDNYTPLTHPRTGVLCCNGEDCAPIKEERVKEVKGGYVIDGKHFVEHKDILPSWDGDFHACFYPGPETLRCFIAPKGGF